MAGRIDAVRFDNPGPGFNVCIQIFSPHASRFAA